MQIPAFDKTMPFYPLVMNYAVQLWAFGEIIARGSTLELRRVLAPAYRAHNDASPNMTLHASAGQELGSFDVFSPFGEEARRIFERGTGRDDVPDFLAFRWGQNPFAPKLVRCWAMPEDGLDIDADGIACDFASGDPKASAARAFGAAGCSLIIAAFAEVERFKFGGPLWQFFRHCRNAGAHGNRFHFMGDEPKEEATWRSLRIVRELHGRPLISIAGGSGFFDPGDPILLLWDVERAILQGHPGSAGHHPPAPG